MNRIKNAKHIIFILFFFISLIWLMSCSKTQQSPTSKVEVVPIAFQFKDLDINVDFKNISDVAFSPDSKQMAVSDDDMYLHLFGLEEDGG